MNEQKLLQLKEELALAMLEIVREETDLDVFDPDYAKLHVKLTTRIMRILVPEPLDGDDLDVNAYFAGVEVRAQGTLNKSAVHAVIHSLQTYHPKGVPQETIIGGSDLAPAIVMGQLMELAESGDIYSPRPNLWRITG